MDPIEEIRRFWAMGALTAHEAAILAVGGSESEACRHYALDLAEATSGPHTTAHLPALDRYRIAIERWLEELGRDPTRPFPVGLFGEWLRKHRDYPGYQLARDAGVDLRNRRPRKRNDPDSEPPPDPEPPSDPRRDRVILLTRWPDHHPWPSVSGLRWLVYNARHNGFDKVIRRAGRRILIDEDAFFEWVHNRDNPKPDK